MQILRGSNLPKVPPTRLHSKDGGVRRIRVLHVVSGLKPGGAEAMLYRLASRMANIEHEVISLGPRDWYSPLLEKHGIPVQHLNFRSTPPGLVGAWKLNKLLRRSRADVVQCWMYRSNVLGGTLAKLARFPVAWNIRCASPHLLRFGSRLWARAGGLLANLVPEVIINLSDRSTEVHAISGYASANVRVIYNGFDPAQFFPDPVARAKTRKDMGIPEECFAIGTISRWDPYKDIPNLLRAMTILVEKSACIRFFLIGSGLHESNRELQVAVDGAGLADYVTMLGPQHDIPAIARALDVHVFPSVSEGFGNVVAETMLSGTPNVVTDVGACGLVVGQTGWIVAPNNSDWLASAVGDAFDEWKQRRADWKLRCVAARKRIETHFSFERMAAEYEKAWRQIAKAGTSIDGSTA